MPDTPQNQTLDDIVLDDSVLDDTILYVVVNNEPILEFDRKKPMPGHQRQYLDNMDSQMDQGIQLVLI